MERERKKGGKIVRKEKKSDLFREEGMQINAGERHIFESYLKEACSAFRQLSNM